MSQKEVRRLEVVKAAMAGEVDQAKAAQLLGLSVRQIKRLCRRVSYRGRPLEHRSFMLHDVGRAVSVLPSHLACRE